MADPSGDCSTTPGDGRGVPTGALEVGIPSACRANTEPGPACSRPAGRGGALSPKSARIARGSGLDGLASIRRARRIIPGAPGGSGRPSRRRMRPIMPCGPDATGRTGRRTTRRWATGCGATSPGPRGAAGAATPPTGACTGRLVVGAAGTGTPCAVATGGAGAAAGDAPGPSGCAGPASGRGAYRCSKVDRGAGVGGAGASNDCGAFWISGGRTGGAGASYSSSVIRDRRAPTFGSRNGSRSPVTLRISSNCLRISGRYFCVSPGMYPCLPARRALTRSSARPSPALYPTSVSSTSPSYLSSMSRKCRAIASAAFASSRRSWADRPYRFAVPSMNCAMPAAPFGDVASDRSPDSWYAVASRRSGSTP